MKKGMFKNSRKSSGEETIKQKKQKYVIENLPLLSHNQLDEVTKMIKEVKFKHGI